MEAVRFSDCEGRTLIDIHTHILPEIDDGAGSLEEALELAEQAVRNGIRTVVATPHHYARGYYSDAEQIKLDTNKLNDELYKRNIPLEVLTGQEVRVYDRLLEDLEAGRLATIASSPYLLVEFPSSNVPSQVDELFHELRLLDVTPIIAHPERNRELADNHDLLEQLVEAGALAQLTSSSVCGTMGRKLQKLSLEMCKRGLVHFVASDAHHAKTRPFDLAQGYEAIGKHLGQAFVDYYQLNAERLIGGHSIQREIPAAKRRFIFW